MNIIITWLLGLDLKKLCFIALPPLILAICAMIYYSGIRHSENSALINEQQAVIKAWETRSAIDNETQNLTLVKLCLELGGLLPDCEEQLRGVDTTPKSEKPR